MSRNYSSDPKGRKFISVAAFLLTIALIGVLNVLRLYLLDKFPQYMPDAKAVLPVRVITALMMIFAAVYVVFILILLPLWYKTIRYVINDKEVISRSGLFSRTYRIMKIDSVQHAVRISLPLAKYTSFNFISLKALGGTMPLMFLSDKDCREILDFFRGRLDKKHEPKKFREKYSVSYSPEGSGYVYTDNSAILSHAEISRIAGDYESVTQLTFDEPAGSEQLTFGDMNGEDDGL